MKTAMKRLTMFACWLAIVAMPAGVLGAPEQQSNNALVKKETLVKNEKKEEKEKTVPEPSMILLVGAAAAAFAGLRKRLRRTEG